MMTSTPSLLSSSPTRAFRARIGCSPSLRRMTLVKPPRPARQVLSSLADALIFLGPSKVRAGFNLLVCPRD
eukprot:3092654-Amphidinium_carterae.1